MIDFILFIYFLIGMQLCERPLERTTSNLLKIYPGKVVIHVEHTVHPASASHLGNK